MSEKITFKELVEKIAEQSQQSYNSTDNFIKELVQIVEGGLSKNGSVTISGFGKFELRWMKERPGINPQTGEEITIPGQNKVVFKPYKALREQVNKPYSKMTAQILDEEVRNENAPPDSDSEESLDDILIERESPVANTEPAGNDLSTSDIDNTPVVPADKSGLTKEIEKSSNFKWSYAAAVIVVLLAIMAIIFLMQQQASNQTSEPPLSEQTEQPAEQETPQQDMAEDRDDPADQTEEEPADAPAATPDNGEQTDEEPQLELQSHTVSPGESLWTIAETQLGNPYLWPLIYYLNQDLLDNPNQLTADGDLEIPTISDPDNLTNFEQEQAALGYFSLYKWMQINNPDEARYFLWAVGIFSPELLEERASEVDAEDLAFATQR